MTLPADWPGLADEDLLLAVANTAHSAPDEFADAGSLRTWWRGLGAPAAADGGRPVTPEGLATLRTLRALIRGLALRNNGIEPDLSVTPGLDALSLRFDLRAVPSLRADRPGDLARDVSAATVAALLRASARPAWFRVKACRGDDCRWVFIDGSRNTSRRWCAMAACGNRAKTAAFRDRHRTAASHP
jgi:predicted RNA-binding Zn ribbon-like protein